MSTKARLFPFINESSGSNLGQKRSDWLRSRIPPERLGEMTVVGPDDDFEAKQQDCLKLCKEADGIILLSGGDGTVNGWLDLLHESQVPFALLPSGTFNLFAHDFNIPLDLDKALELALNGVPTKTGMGLINGHPFIVSASVGLHTRILEERQKSTDLYGRNRLVAFISSAFAALSKIYLFSARVKLPEGHQSFKTPMVMATLSESHLVPIGIEPNKKLRKDALACFVLKAKTWKQMLAVLVKGATGFLSHDKHLMVSELKEFEFSINKKRLKACLDGEFVYLYSPMKVKLKPEALNFVYQSAEEAS